MIEHADDAFRNLPPEHLSRLPELGIGSLSDYIQPDYSRSGEWAVFGRTDPCHPSLKHNEGG